MMFFTKKRESPIPIDHNLVGHAKITLGFFIIIKCVFFRFSLNNFYAVGDPVYARDLWLVVELASDDRGRRTREGKEVSRLQALSIWVKLGQFSAKVGQKGQFWK